MLDLDLWGKCVIVVPFVAKPVWKKSHNRCVAYVAYVAYVLCNDGSIWEEEVS